MILCRTPVPNESDNGLDNGSALAPRRAHAGIVRTG
jgi:hypothetical protein